jgi:LuxR family maltose regulon positive regulatory protein
VAAGPSVIPATKLHIPSVRAGIVPRDGLVELLVRGRSRKLTLLDAPAGFGKTTLLAEWCAAPQEERPFAWVSLDAADNDAVRFWSCVIDALDGVEPGTGARARETLGAGPAALEDATLPLLLNDLAELGRPLVLVLDDYHLIRDKRVHSSVEYLLRHLADGVHLAIATRSDPELPLGRLRARGELTELRVAQLRLSDEEASGLLRAAVGVELDEGDVARLVSRTEGWAAGLYLAALSLRGHADTRAFIGSFAGDDRHIVDYLSSEVLSGQPPELRDFLVRTSILQRLSGPLCDAVAGRADSARVLEHVERDNLFLVPLDTTREWYRYHHLFGELLRHELRRSHAEWAAGLHRAAYRWYRAAGAIPDAIEHAAAAGDSADAAELIAAHWNDYFNRGHLDTVDSWLSALPPGTVSADPRLALARAWLALDRGRLDEADRWIGTAEARLGVGDAWDTSVRADAAVLRSTHSFKAGDLQKAREAARAVLALGPAGAPFPTFVARCMLGVTSYWSGEPAEAEAALEQALGIAESERNELGQSYVHGYLALARAELGAPEDAARASDAALALSEAGGFGEHFVVMMGQLARGRLGELRGDLDEAEQALTRAVALARRGAGGLERASALLALGQVHHARGRRDSAAALLHEARSALDDCADTGRLDHGVEALDRALRARGRARRASPGVRDELTDREIAVLRLLEGELSRREIAAALYVSLDTVKTHIRGIYRKLGAGTREEAVAAARERGLI